MHLCVFLQNKRVHLFPTKIDLRESKSYKPGDEKDSSMKKHNSDRETIKTLFS